MPKAPQDPQDATPKPTPTEVAKEVAPEPTKPKDPFDLGSILLPKKETPGQTPQSAQRVNAGALLAQEQSATLLAPTKEEAPKVAPLVESLVPPPTQEPESIVKSIETYRGDIESAVKDKNVSMVTIAAAEAVRRGNQQNSEQENITPGARQSSSLLKTIGLYTLGIVLLAGASGALAYIVNRPSSVDIPQAEATPFIAVDATKEITITSGTSRDELMPALTAAKTSTVLSLGLISRILISTASSTSVASILTPIDSQSFFTLIAPNMPPALLRTIRHTYLLGVHVYDNNQPFLILSVDSYEQAYAGMIAWETFMKQDLSPLFNVAPKIHIPEEGIATTTPETQFIQSGFVDSVVENHDARVIQNESGDISLLWTFLDRNTLVIATNAATVREIISRIKNAPITPDPSLQ